jgi:nitrogen fixation protein NifU and related proteins
VTSYSAVLLDHAAHPRNVGSLPDPDAAFEAENPVCGDHLRLELRIRSGTIEAVRWQADGCHPAIAAASVTSELLQGMSIDAAVALDRTRIANALGGLPPRKMHAASLVLTAVVQALAAYTLRAGTV